MKEDLAYKENKGLARQWQEYSARKPLSSRTLESVPVGHLANLNQDSLQLLFVFSNVGNLPVNNCSMPGRILSMLPNSSGVVPGLVPMADTVSAGVANVLF